MNKDKIIIIILLLVFIQLVVLNIHSIVEWNIKHENCYRVEYEQYSCEGATHYAKIHRRSNEPCKRTKLICNK